MGWLVAIGILVLAYLFAVGYRRSAGGLAIGILLVAVSLYFYNERQEQIATSRIPVSEVTLEHVDLKPTFRSGYDLTGTIRNKSTKYRLDGFGVTVTLRDCRGKGPSSCSVVGQASSFTGMTVPPQTSADFVVSLHFGNDRPNIEGRLEWDYEVTEATARRQ